MPPARYNHITPQTSLRCNIWEAVDPAALTRGGGGAFLLLCSAHVVVFVLFCLGFFFFCSNTSSKNKSNEGWIRWKAWRVLRWKGCGHTPGMFAPPSEFQLGVQSSAERHANLMAPGARRFAEPLLARQRGFYLAPPRLLRDQYAAS